MAEVRGRDDHAVLLVPPACDHCNRLLRRPVGPPTGAETVGRRSGIVCDLGRAVRVGIQTRSRLTQSIWHEVKNRNEVNHEY